MPNFISENWARFAHAAVTFIFEHQRVLLWLGLVYLLYGLAEAVIMVLEAREGPLSRWSRRLARIVVVVAILTIGTLHCLQFEQVQVSVVANLSLPP